MIVLDTSSVYEKIKTILVFVLRLTSVACLISLAGQNGRPYGKGVRSREPMEASCKFLEGFICIGERNYGRISVLNIGQGPSVHDDPRSRVHKR